MTDAKAAARATVEAASDALVELSHLIHAHPELKFEEHRSSEWTAAALSDGGFSIEMGVADLPTAFVATAGSGPVVVGICAEYDALPAMGHACGHNVIAAAAVGAGLALAPLADDLGLTVKVFGTPAEEGGGGKIIMLEHGVFAGVHAAMMVHPSPLETIGAPWLAVSHFDVHYHGKAAHASAWPEQGINAADALTVAQVGIGLLRQHIRATDRIHGIVTHGGDAPNVIPDSTGGEWMVRARSLAELADIEPRVHRCFEAGALATGSTLSVTPIGPAYSEMTPDLELQAAYRANAEALGRRFVDIPPDLAARTAGSTDMANVSLTIPTIHPMLGLDSLPAVNHQPEFAAACATPTADAAVVGGATAMAWTCIDIATTDALRDRLTASG
ncbi:MAG: M20 family metallopeptidase [Acidimicrobiales bacterium]